MLIVIERAIALGNQWHAERTSKSGDSTKSKAGSGSDSSDISKGWDGRLTVLYDRRNYSLAHMRVLLPFVKLLGARLSDHYPERLHLACIWPISWTLWVVWKIAKHFINPATAAKLKFTSDKA